MTMMKQKIDYNGKYTITIAELIKQGQKIFPDNYPFYDPTHKSEFETKFIRHFKRYEISMDNFEDWKEEFLDTLVINYPKYKHYFDTEVVAKDLRWWFNKDYDVEHNRVLSTKDQANNHNESVSTSVNKYIAKNEDKNNSNSKYLDTPQGNAGLIDDGFMSNMTQDSSNNISNNSGNSEGNGTNRSDSNNQRTGQDIEIIRNKEYGNIGTTSSGDLVRSWLSDGYFNIDLMIIKDCQELFMFFIN